MMNKPTKMQAAYFISGAIGLCALLFLLIWNMPVNRNSPSWDAALVAIAMGQPERRLSWDWDNRYIFTTGRIPLDLNDMKLYMCFSSQCTPQSRENYTPTKGDKTAGDWIPAQVE